MAFIFHKGLREIILGSKHLQDVSAVTTAPTVQLMLVNSTGYTINRDDQAIDAGGGTGIVLAEINVTNYAPGYAGAGRKTLNLGNLVFTSDSANDKFILDYNLDLTWTALGSGATIAGGVVMVKGATNDTDSIPIAYIDLTTPVATNGGNFTFQFHANGIFTLPV